MKFSAEHHRDVAEMAEGDGSVADFGGGIGLPAGFYTIEEVSLLTLLAGSCVEFLRAERVERCRETAGRRKAVGPPKILNLRDCVTDLRLEGRRLVMRLRGTPSGTAKPVEILEALGLPVSELGHTLRRACVRWAGLERVEAESLPHPRASAPASAGSTTGPPGSAC